MAKYIVVTGGVVSGLGKGITTASIGLLLKNSGFKVDAIKFDPYLNIDPGTMSPYEHGEVYVLEDGSETDLDLGHYERFLDTNLNKNSSVTAGKIYDAILSQEREGSFLGKNVQLIPHVTNYIQSCLTRDIDEKDGDKHIRLIEIGGSTGDMEGEIFLESFRQFRQSGKNQVLHIHLGYVPFLKCSGEYKSKPLQNSVRELLKAGLQPDIIVARYYAEKGKKISSDLLDKIALFSNLSVDSVISLPDLESIYSVPLYLQESNMLANLERFTGKKLQPTLPSFYSKIRELKNFDKKVNVAIIAKYPKLIDAYLSLVESLKIAGVALDSQIEFVFVDAEKLEEGKKFSENEWIKLKAAQAVIIPGGFGSRGMEGKVCAIKYARENKIPFLGICLGLQMAVVEFCRNVADINAFSSEMDNLPANGSEIVIDLIPEQKSIHKKGGTMRLGSYNCSITPNSLANTLYGSTEVTERHRHRLEVQEKYTEVLEKNGMVISGKHYFENAKKEQRFLVELIELDSKIHPYFIAIQSHPEFLSRPDKPHPLFFGLIKAALKKRNNLT